VRQLPALTSLDVSVDEDPFNFGHEHQWLPFIPPALKALFMTVTVGFAAERLLPLFPGMLEASGARLERLQMYIPCEYEGVDDVILAHMAKILHCCSPTLEGFYLGTGLGWFSFDEKEQDHAERVGVMWADVLAGVLSCRELQVLVLPPIRIEPSFPPGTAFARLTHLEISDYEREHPPDAGVMGLWELVASGGLPALTKLSLMLVGRWGGVEEVRSRVVPAFEAVAGTLTHLYLVKPVYGEWSSDEVDVGYEWGVAVGKLRRLKDLALDLSQDGRAYQGMAQGLAASGGDPPLPLLWRLRVFSFVNANTDLLPCLLLPSVRVFGTVFACNLQVGLLIVCALREAGYQHTLIGDQFAKKLLSDVVRVVAPCTRLGDTIVGHPGWCRIVDDTPRL
jgi:hypothetical protein